MEHDALAQKRREMVASQLTARGIADERVLQAIRDVPREAFVPETFIDNLSHYTALRVAYRHIKRATTDDGLREGLDLLWDIALPSKTVIYPLLNGVCVMPRNAWQRRWNEAHLTKKSSA